MMNEEQKQRAKAVYNYLISLLSKHEELVVEDGELKKAGRFETENIISYNDVPLAACAGNGAKLIYFSYENESVEQMNMINELMP